MMDRDQDFLDPAGLAELDAWDPDGHFCIACGVLFVPCTPRTPPSAHTGFCPECEHEHRSSFGLIPGLNRCPASTAGASTSQGTERLKVQLQQPGTEHIQVRPVLARSESLCSRCYQCAVCEEHFQTIRALQAHLMASWDSDGDCSSIYRFLTHESAARSSVPANSSGKRGREEEEEERASASKKRSREEQEEEDGSLPQNSQRPRDVVIPGRKRARKTKHLDS